MESDVFGKLVVSEATKFVTKYNTCSNLQLHSQELSSTNEKLEKTVQGIETYGINKHSIMQQNNFLSQRHSIESLEKTIQEILALVTKQNFIVQENNLHCQKLNSNIESLEKTTQGIVTLVTKQSSIMQENNFRSQELNSNLNNLEKTVQEIETHVIKQVWKVNSLEENVIKILQSVEKTLPETCADISDCQSGVYHIQPRTRCPYTFEVFCDQEYEGGGWLVIHNRYDGSVGFYRDWEEYEAGFGDLHGEFWLGLKKIHELTYAKPHELHIILEDIDGKVVTAHYDRFVVGGPETKYVLKSLGTYTGTAGDSLSIHAGMKFTTIDNDNDAPSRHQRHLNSHVSCQQQCTSFWRCKCAADYVNLREDSCISVMPSIDKEITQSSDGGESSGRVDSGQPPPDVVVTLVENARPIIL
ncbi:fibrinogen-like protein 1 [Sabethes cyaneus]|uniref:fibrinogen-like protein 1 n=1 Tax=Sabethes cyaneus TaxID=53552 RepID=UPI00237DEA45|nr:fibrinogen-like protein 1 [Sabethes cyaneus]